VPDILHRLSWKLEQSQLENESIEDTAERIGISKVYLKNHIEKKKVVSFDSQDSDGETYIEVAGDIFADSLVSKKDTKDIIEIAIKKLPERMQTIIRMRFFSDVNNTLDDVSEKLQVSRERVRQIESSALKMLKFHLSK
jgi:RNA polymerase sigma factor (sigma-70 family)